MHISKIMSLFTIEDAHALVVVNTEMGRGSGFLLLNSTKGS